MNDYRNLAADLVAALKKAGADACDVYIVGSTNFNTNIRLGAIEKLEHEKCGGSSMVDVDRRTSEHA